MMCTDKCVPRLWFSEVSCHVYFQDGIPVVPGPDVHITIDSGASTLDIPRAKASDAAWYQCTAQNVAGSTATRARLFVETPKGSVPEPRRLNLPRPTRVIEPE
jgi:hypothetical protein